MSESPPISRGRPAAYPSTDSLDAALRNGSTVHLRPVSADDKPLAHSFLEGVSQTSLGFRFFGAANLDWVTDWAVDVDYADRYALVAITGAEQEIVAHAAYIRTDDVHAEVAFLVADAWQGHGIATIMLAQLAAAAERHGISVFTAEVLPDNHRMIEVFRESGFPVEVHARDGVIYVELPTSLSAEVQEAFERRDQTASVAAVRSVLAPRSVAVIGASRRRGTVGGEILHNLVAGGFQGVVYPINSSATAVQTMPAFRSVGELPGPVELAVIAVPAVAVVDAARECGAAGVRSLVVISAGFAEVGAAGTRRQRELLEVCRTHGMRLVGPNCLGVLNTAAGVALNATFMPRAPTTGHVGFLSQSGGLGIAIVDAANRLRLGLSAFVSIGNKADLSGNDFIRYWEQDPSTDVILLYLESFGNARKFARIARQVGRTKPIAAVKSGRSVAGARATASHTGALLAASDVSVDALFRQAGVIRTDTLAELFDVAALLSSQPAPRGNRVAIVTNAGGPGILCSDACEASGLEVAELPSRLRARLRRFLPAEAALADPVDMIATASAEDYRRTIEALGRANVADAIIAIFIPPLVTAAADVAAAISQAAERIPPEIGVLAVFMADDAAPIEPQRSGRPIPVYMFPEEAARALGHAARYGLWRDAPAGRIPQFDDCRPDEAAAVIARALGAGVGWLAPSDVASLLDCYGVRSPASRQVADPVEAGRAAAELGGRVALKAVAPGLVHKSDAGGVRVGLEPERVERSAQEMTATLEKAGLAPDGFLVQAMAPAGVELIVGVVQDRAFGPLIACGAGGTSAELLRDVAVRLTPLSDLDAREMPRSLKLFPLLEGYRGAPHADVAGLEDLLLRVSALVETHPEIAEMDLNPVVALPDGPLVIDARIWLEPSVPAPTLPSLAGSRSP
jgi:acetyl coenzyme A synthetase (ADP forming)-like protein